MPCVFRIALAVIISSGCVISTFSFAEVVDKTYITFDDSEVSAIENDFLNDARDGTLNQFSLIEGYLLLTGNGRKENFLAFKKQYLQKIKPILNATRRQKTDIQKAANLVEGMHGLLVKQYELNSIFMDDLLERGLFNCVSSAAVYGDLLDRLNIRHQYAFVQKHVYQYVLVDKTKILVETTSPIGFNPGRQNARTNAAGVVVWMPHKNYQNIYLANKLEFLGMLCMDKRILLKQKGDIDKNLTLAKKGLILNLHPSLINNYMVWSYKKGNALIEQKKLLPNKIKDYLINSIKIFPSSIKHQQAQSSLLAKLFAGSLIKQQYAEVNKSFIEIKTLLQPPIYVSMVENSFALACDVLLKKNQFNELEALAKFGATILPNSKSIESVKLFASKENFKKNLDIEKFIKIHFKQNIEKNRLQSKAFKQHFYEIINYLFQTSEINNIDKAFRILSSYLTKPQEKQYFPQFANDVFQNLLYQSHQSKTYVKGLAIYGIALQYTKGKLVERNYLSLLEQHSAVLYHSATKDSLEQVINFLLSEQTKYKNLQSHDYFSSRMGYFVVQEVGSGSSKEIVAYLKKLSSSLSVSVWQKFIYWVLVNGTYKLHQAGAYQEALFLLNQFPLPNNNKVKNNYLACLQQLTEEIVVQNDYNTPLRIFKEAFKLNPQWKEDISSLALSHFATHLINVYNQGNTALFKSIFVSLHDSLLADDYNKLFQIIYVNGTYHLIRKQKYREAIKLAEIGLQDKKDISLQKNYQFALQKMKNS